MHSEKDKSFWQIVCEQMPNSDLAESRAMYYKRAILTAIEENNEAAVLEGLHAFLSCRADQTDCFYENTLKALMSVVKKLPELDHLAYAEAEKKNYIPFDRTRKAIFREVAQAFGGFALAGEEEEADKCFTFLVDIYQANYLSIMAGTVCRMIEDTLKQTVKEIEFVKLERWLVSNATPRELTRVLGSVWTRNGGYEKLPAFLRAHGEKEKLSCSATAFLEETTQLIARLDIKIQRLIKAMEGHGETANIDYVNDVPGFVKVRYFSLKEIVIEIRLEEALVPQAKRAKTNAFVHITRWKAQNPNFKVVFKVSIVDDDRGTEIL